MSSSFRLQRVALNNILVAFLNLSSSTNSTRGGYCVSDPMSSEVRESMQIKVDVGSWTCN